MWWLAAEAVPSSPPEVPYETIGTILVALIGAIVAITVAVLQRASKNTAPATTPVVAFAVPEAEWIAVRDRSLQTATQMVDLSSDLGKLEDRVTRNDGRIEHIKGSLGLE